MLAYLAYKVKQLVWKQDKIMPITLMFFTAYIFSALISQTVLLLGTFNL